LANGHFGRLPAGAQPVQEQGDGGQDAEVASVRAGGGGAVGEEGRSRQAEDRHRLRQPDSVLRVPALNSSERPPHRVQRERRLARDGRRPRPVHRGVSQALWEQSGVMTSFVEVARREKLQELVRRGVAPYAYRFERTATARAALEGFRDGDARTHRLAGRLVALRPHGKTTFA